MGHSTQVIMMEAKNLHTAKSGVVEQVAMSVSKNKWVIINICSSGNLIL